MSRFRFRSAVPIVLIVLLVPAVLAAQTSPPAPPTFQEEMVVTANLVESPAGEVGSSVTVIGRDEIERRGATSVLDLLRTVPGLEASQGGGAGTVGGVFLRGANSNHTLVLIDGVRVVGTSAAFDFSGLRADGVERIEILRGPQSTLYGSEAIGGVISITTLQGRPGFHADVDGRAGSYDSHELRAAADGGGDGWDYSVSVAGQRTGGLSVASDQRGNVEKDPYTGRSGAARVGFRFLGDGRADVTFRRTDTDADLDGFTFGAGPTDDPNATQQRQVTVGSLQLAKPLAPWWNLHLTVNASEDATQGKDPDTEFNNYDFSTRLRAVKAQSEIKLGTGNTLVAGLASERRQGRNRGSYDESLDVDSAYLQDDWSWRSRLFLTAGLRHDRYSRFGDETTWRTTGSWLAGPSSAWKVHGSYGTGFRGPSFDELFFPFLGNTALRPETSRGWDLGVERRFGNPAGIAAAGVTWFSNRFDDLINFDLGTFTFANIQKASSQGIEATLSLQPRRDLAVEAAYTYDETEDLATGRPLARRPRNRLSLLATWDASEKLRGTASVVNVEDRIDADGTRMDAYTQVDLRIEYSLRPWLQPYLMIGNLLGQRYEEITGYTSAGFSASLGFRLRSK